jgi:pilus assembly protein CpaE
MAEVIQVLVVDETADGRGRLRRLLGGKDVNVCGEADLGAAAVAAAQEYQPNVIVLSLEKPIARGLRTIEAITASMTDRPVVVVSSLGDRDTMRQAMLAGARDYLAEPYEPEDLAKAVRAAYALVTKQRVQQAGGPNGTAYRGEVLAVFGAKGGVGRTMLATNLAVALATAGRQRVALVDLDLTLGDVAIMLDVAPERSFLDLVPAGGRLDGEALQRLVVTHPSGVNVVPAPPRPEEHDQVTGSQVERVLQSLARTHDFVVVDVPRHFDERLGATLELANRVLLVTSTEMPSVKNARLVLNLFRTLGLEEDQVKVVVNHVGPGGLNPREIQEVLDFPVFWKVPYDGAVQASVRHGKPVVIEKPRSALGQNLIELSRTLAGAGPVRQRNVFKRLFRRA